ncbi:MAG: ATP-dependent DNA helicase RecG [candidate division NC10 bacterium]|nr:ATP-dependent DNA helicase RecG [candidate division NC10 bacterium]
MVDLQTSIQYVKGIGPKRAKLLEKLGVRTIEDALYLLPRRYEDRRNLKPIAEVRVGDLETVAGEVLASGLHQTRRGLSIFELVIGDRTGILSAKWFNQPYLQGRFKKGEQVILSGKVSYGLGLQMLNPEHETLLPEDEPIHTARVVPIYPLTQGLSQRSLRSLMKAVTENYALEAPDHLPPGILAKNGLLPLPEALHQIHFPLDLEAAESARRRLAFDDFFLLGLGLALMRREVRVVTDGISFPRPSPLEERACQGLPYFLTAAQERALATIKADMARPRPMNRLLQGDVGAGKTIVAFLAALVAIDHGYQAALMAPTEILADQHYLRAQGLLGPLGIAVRLLNGSLKAPLRRRVMTEIKEGKAQLTVGTHALIQEGVEFANLGFIIIDEQHRFGVLQRAGLQKKGYRPDVLVMTATPIPRTLALTLYGDLDLTIIDEMPPGRRPVKTYLVHEGRREGVYRFIARELRAGRQAYVVCPLVEETEKADLKAAVKMARELARAPFRDFRVGLLHGRMPLPEKEAVMGAFQRGELDLLVATTVVEVGVDVPNASVMLIEHAERLGLSQLHQLRGRVGRSRHSSYCFLLPASSHSTEARERLQALVEHADGFLISEKDLEIRGPGDFFGTRQSGLPDLKVANLIRDTKILEIAREEAFSLIELDPCLDLEDHRLLKAALRKRWQDGLRMFTVA